MKAPVIVAFFVFFQSAYVLSDENLTANSVKKSPKYITKYILSVKNGFDFYPEREYPFVLSKADESGKSRKFACPEGTYPCYTYFCCPIEHVPFLKK